MIRYSGIFALLSLLPLATSLLAVDPTGTWRWVHPDIATQKPVTDELVVVYKGGQISGTYETARGKRPIENGLLDGDTLSFELNISANGQQLRLAFRGEIKKDLIDGTLTFGDFGDFPWTPKRAPQAFDPTGTWRWEHDDAATGERIKDALTLETTDGKITGTYLAGAKAYPVKQASVDGDTISWSFDLEVGGQTVTLDYTGDLRDNEVEGTVTIAGLGEFPWKATRDRNDGDLAGTWNLTLQTPTGAIQHPQLTLTNNGGAYAGSYESAGQSLPLEDVSFADGTLSFTVSIGELDITSRFKAEFRDGQLAGVVDYKAAGQSGQVDWSAEKPE